MRQSEIVEKDKGNFGGAFGARILSFAGLMLDKDWLLKYEELDDVESRTLRVVVVITDELICQKGCLWLSFDLGAGKHNLFQHGKTLVERIDGSVVVAIAKALGSLIAGSDNVRDFCHDCL